MILQDKKSNTYSRKVSEFRGLNQMPVAPDGELRTCKNLVFDKFPVMTSAWQDYFAQSSIGYLNSGFLTSVIGGSEPSFGYFARDKLYYPNFTGTIVNDGNKVSVVEFHGKLFIFPDKIVYDPSLGITLPIGSGTYPAPGSCPDIDYAVVHNNRIWGVKGNYVYASSLGYAMGAAGDDGRYGWTQFYDANGDPDESGSFYQEVGSAGDFTGIASWDNRVELFKEDMHYEINGSYPSNFSLSTISSCGAISNRSICEVNNSLYYMSHRGIVKYSGGKETVISSKLEMYDWRMWPAEGHEDRSLACGTDGVRYYFVPPSNPTVCFVYNTIVGCWTQIEAGGNDYYANFCLKDGVLYAIRKNPSSNNGSIVECGYSQSPRHVIRDQNTEWEFSFSDYNDSIYGDSSILSLALKMKGQQGKSCEVYVSTDGAPEVLVKDFIFESKTTMHKIKIPLNRGTEHVIRVKGSGHIEVYGYQIIAQKGGENIV